MRSVSSLRTQTLQILSDIALHKLAMITRLLSENVEGKSAVTIGDNREDTPNVTPAGLMYSDRIGQQMITRDWTPEQIDHAFNYGDKIAIVVQKRTATRYIHMDTRRSVVVDNVSREILHVGRTSFKFAEKPNASPNTLSPKPATPTTGVSNQAPDASGAPGTGGAP